MVSLKQLGTFRSFKNPVFLLYYGGLLGQMAGMNMQMITRSLLVYRMTGSATILGIMSLANAIPMILFSLYGGVIADRLQKKYVMLVGQACSMLVSLGIALALTIGYLSIENAHSYWILIISSALQGAIMGLMMPSRQSILPEIVSGKEIMNAVSLTTMGMNVLSIIAPALAGFLIDGAGFAAVYFTISGMYMISMVLVSFLPRTGKINGGAKNALTEIKEGLRYVIHERTILLLLLIALLIGVLSMPIVQLLSVFTEDILDVGASGLGMLFSVSGVGAIVGSLLLASLPNKRRGLMMLVGSLLLGLALTGFSFSNSWHLSLGLIVIVGFGLSVRLSLSNTLIQYYVDNDYRGRVMSLWMMQFGLINISTFLAGILTDFVGVQWAIGGLAMVLILVSILALVFLPRIRRLD